MCLINEFFETLKLKEGKVVLLENNKVYKVQYMRSVKLKMFDNWEILQDGRYVIVFKLTKASTIVKGVKRNNLYI